MSASIATLPSANSRQVGGTHYKTGGMEHWDLFGPEYYMGCASKYVSRHSKKGGREDLEKALHYCDKMVEALNGRNLTNTVSTSQMLQWAQNTSMGGLEIAICFQIICVGNGEKARQLIKELIRRDYPDEVNWPGTPEDGGHHALQPPDQGEEIRHWTQKDVEACCLPPSLTEHEWQHRCSEYVQGCYYYDVHAARYLINECSRSLCVNCVRS